ncbi:BtrH N-terminal domain-containing protein [Chitinophaga nivalis]|uniref:BtrH N-terminal domain-containing protein n=1 Tax=Chitinophaga nivalis TaxID=2991709 RepID=A0ABT3ISF9_9BACT|nr:BtrH N-terminal domain-containing protein [Chitinophaga nivalis]MCW3463393.1 BtrH N-terminal domain-containing protein [Chitinophaga nivalis]MCW3486917.1 BtrH N-terminal domain-containing protein [Chitinophaga nivalis]
MNNTIFHHKQTAHCESGVISNLLGHHGLKISEPMAFGIGAGLFFAHLPFIKVNGVPGTTYRIWPGAISQRVCKRLGVKMEAAKFSTPAKGMAALDDVIEAGIPVGLLSSVYYLPYFPASYRFHFNAHNLVVYGKKEGQYLVSDPVMDTVTEIDPDSLVQARFAKGFPAPKGKMYYPVHVPANASFRQPIKEGIQQTCHYMLKVPLPMFGVSGIRFLANRVKSYPEKVGDRKATLYLGNVIRMQEEIGTGGAGFRFLYAAFLQEAAEMLQKDELGKLAGELTKTGDLWRNFAFAAGRVCKSRAADTVSYKDLSEMLLQCAASEDAFFRKLAQVKW